MKSAEARTTAVGLSIVAVLVIVAAFIVGRTPGDVLGDIDSQPGAVELPSGQVEYTLSPGSSAADIGSELEAAGVIESGRQFELLVSLMGVHNQIQADTYVFEKGLPAATVIDRMVNRETVEVVRVFFPEGIRIEEMAAITGESGYATPEAFLAAVGAAPVPEALGGIIPEGDGFERFQGFLFPDTYLLPVNGDAALLVSRMLERTIELYTPELQAAASAQGLTPFEAITLAAIVEREAVIAEERAIIASVFLNRLRDGMKLDADPTVQYTVAQDPASVAEHGYWKTGLTTEDLGAPSPYNTYLNAGLPPGPITNPGLAAIDAVAHPETTTYYYFVADATRGDGSHVFAETFDEHVQNVALYGG